MPEEMGNVTATTPSVTPDVPVVDTPTETTEETDIGFDPTNITDLPDVPETPAPVIPETPEVSETPELPPEVQQLDENKEEEIEEFDPDKISDEELEKDEALIIEGYDLNEYKDILDFDDPEAKEIINSELKRLKELGFTPEQAKVYIDSHLQAYQEQEQEEREMYSQKGTEKRLKENLTKDEWRNYKNIANWVKTSESMGIPKQHINDALGNPALVKMLNALYSSNVNNNKVVEQKNPTPKVTTVSPIAVREQWEKWISKQDKVSVEASKAYLDQFKPYIKEDDKGLFDTIFKSIYKEYK